MLGAQTVRRFFLFGWLLAATLVLGAPTADLEDISKRQSTGRLVFCHFMAGFLRPVPENFKLTHLDRHRWRSYQRSRLRQ